MAKVITTERWPARHETWEPPYDIVVGITQETCGAQWCTLARVVVPPGGGNQYHIHENAEALGFVVRGTFRNEIVGDVIDIQAGDFWHFAKQERHWSHNLSNTDICMMVAAYVPVSTLAATRTSFVDPSLTLALSKAPKDQLPEPGSYGPPARSRIIKRSTLTTETDPVSGITTVWGASRDNAHSPSGISFQQFMPIGTATPLRVVENAEFAAFVLDGNVVVEAGEPLVRQNAPAGSFIYVPPGEPRRLTSVGPEKAELYVVMAGVGHRDDLRSRVVGSVSA